MLLAIRGGVFATLAVLLIWKLTRAVRGRQISSRGFTFALETSPIWFSLGVVCYLGMLAFSLAEVLSAFGLAGDPAVAIKAYLHDLI